METVSHIVAIYAQIDLQIATFQVRTGLRCPGGCGLCCPEAEVFTSSLEMLPVAHEVLCRGESEIWLQRIQDHGPKSLCVFYRQQIDAAAGHCSFYNLRPSICRLFGFAAIRNRWGDLMLSACRHLKKSNPEEVARACAHQSEAPCFSHFGTLLAAVDLSAIRQVAINEALREAILRMGLYMQIAKEETRTINSAA